MTFLAIEQPQYKSFRKEGINIFVGKQGALCCLSTVVRETLVRNGLRNAQKTKSHMVEKLLLCLLPFSWSAVRAVYLRNPLNPMKTKTYDHTLMIL